jgi:hypothetical protein
MEGARRIGSRNAFIMVHPETIQKRGRIARGSEATKFVPNLQLATSCPCSAVIAWLGLSNAQVLCL